MRLLGVLCVLCGLVSPALALDREAFAFTDYNLDVRIEPEQQRLAVRGKVTLRNDSALPQKTVFLQISSTLGWRSINIEGKPTEFTSHSYASDIDHTGALSEAIVPLPQEVLPRGTLELDVGYEGVIPLDATRLTRIGAPEEKARHSDWDQISKSFTAVRGIGYVAWYPVATEGASLADGDSVPEAVGRWKAKETDAFMKVKITRTGESSISPALCNGKGGVGLYEEISRAYLVTTDCSYAPLRSTVPVFVVGNYSAVDRAPVNVSYLPGQEGLAKTYAELAQEISPAIPRVDGGSDSLRIVELPDPDAMPFVTEGTLLTPFKLPVTNDVELNMVYAKARHMVLSPRAWIQEGLAHYAQVEFIEAQQGRQSALNYLNAHVTALVESEKPAEENSATMWQTSHSLLNRPVDLQLQTKAMYVWWMLKDILGNLPVEALLDYHASDDKDVAYLQRLIQARSHRDLQWFFDDWVYHDRGSPDFRISAVYPHKVDTGGYLITVEIENLGDAGAEIPITLRLPETDITRRLEVHAKSKASIRIEAPVLPLDVVVNDGSVPESDVSNNTYKIEQR